MRILVWHGYLLEGTGSNIYTRAVAREWARVGYDVVVFCQDPEPERFDLGGAEVVRPRLDTRLPVFVVDRYEGLEPVLLQDMPAEERERYVATNAAALREHLPADLVFANHVLMGGPVAAASGARFAVKAHGSELEYSMRGNIELQELGAVSLRDAGAVFVGSQHIRGVLHDVVGDVEHVHEVPPGVDVDRFVAESRTTHSRSSSPSAAPTRRTPATVRNACRTRGTSSGCASSSPATRRPSSTSGSCSTTRASTCCWRRCVAWTRER